MKKLALAFGIFLPAMVIIHQFSKWIITGISDDFGDGVVVGAFIVVIAFAAVEKFAPKR